MPSFDRTLELSSVGRSPTPCWRRGPHAEPRGPTLSVRDLAVHTTSPAEVTSPRRSDLPSRVAESAEPAPCDACSGCHPPPSPRPREPGHRLCGRRRTLASLGHDGTTDLCSFTSDARARSRAVDPLPREAVASVRVPHRGGPLARCLDAVPHDAPCGACRRDRRAVPSVTLRRAPLAGGVGPFRSQGRPLVAGAGKREELDASRHEQHG